MHCTFTLSLYIYICEFTSTVYSVHYKLYGVYYLVYNVQYIQSTLYILYTFIYDEGGSIILVKDMWLITIPVLY